MAKAAWLPLHGINYQSGTKRGLEGAQAYRENPQNTQFQNPIQNDPFSEIFTWVEAVRKNPPAALFIF
jgi:hypothetical protein